MNSTKKITIHVWADTLAALRDEAAKARVSISALADHAIRAHLHLEAAGHRGRGRPPKKGGSNATDPN